MLGKWGGSLEAVKMNKKGRLFDTSAAAKAVKTHDGREKTRHSRMDRQQVHESQRTAVSSLLLALRAAL